MGKDLLSGLSDEQIVKVRNCKSHEDLLKMAKEEGIELTDEQLNAISGGGMCSDEMPQEWYMDCPYCAGGKGTLEKLADGIYLCKNCNKIYRPNQN